MNMLWEKCPCHAIIVTTLNGSLYLSSAPAYPSKTNKSFDVNVVPETLRRTNLGDLNQDGTIDILDILQEINIILGIIDPTLAQICASDLNADGTVDLLDIILLVQMVLDQ